MLNIGILASHTGTTAQAVMDACQNGTIAGAVVIVISNNADAEILQRAKSVGILARHLSQRTEGSADALDFAICQALLANGVDIVLLAGYLRKIGPKTLAEYTGRIINVHPSLLPQYGGQGMHGRAVHEAVAASQDRITGATVHVVNSEYDEGPIIAQEAVAINADDSASDIEAKVRPLEKSLLIKVLRQISIGEIVFPITGSN